VEDDKTNYTNYASIRIVGASISLVLAIKWWESVVCQGFGGCDPNCQPLSQELYSSYDISDCTELAPGSTYEVTCGKDYTVDDEGNKNKPWLRFACPADTMKMFWNENTYGELIRLIKRNSAPANFHTDATALYSPLRARGYPPRFLDLHFSTAPNWSSRQHLLLKNSAFTEGRHLVAWKAASRIGDSLTTYRLTNDD
jgi:hypothetical protein